MTDDGTRRTQNKVIFAAILIGLIVSALVRLALPTDMAWVGYVVGVVVAGALAVGGHRVAIARTNRD